MDVVVSICILSVAVIFCTLLLAQPVLAAVNHVDFIQGPLASGPEVTKKCLECHEDAALDIMQTTHWTWPAEQKINGKAADRGKNECCQ